MITHITSLLFLDTKVEKRVLCYYVYGDRIIYDVDALVFVQKKKKVHRRTETKKVEKQKAKRKVDANKKVRQTRKQVEKKDI